MDVTDVNHVVQPNSKSINDDVENRLIMQQIDTEDVVLNLISCRDFKLCKSSWPGGDPDFRALLRGINNRGKGGGGDSGAQVDNTEPSARRPSGRPGGQRRKVKQGTLWLRMTVWT